MKKKILGFFLLVFVGVLLGGCTYKTRLADFTILSTKVTKLDVKKGERVRADACNMNVLGITIRADAVNLEEAIDKVLHRNKDNMFLVDGVMYIRNIPLGIFNQSCVEVEGNIATLGTEK